MNHLAYWPYDELTISRADRPNGFVFRTPWLDVTMEVGEGRAQEISSLAERFSAGRVGPEILREVSALFSQLQDYPLSYILPRTNWRAPGDAKPDLHALRSTLPETADSPRSGQWDFDSAIQFSSGRSGIDPLSLFSVVRRFHLLDSVQRNKTGELLEFLKKIKDDAGHFANACALTTKQNEYVTQECNASLEPALAIAGTAEGRVRDFIKAEMGHDKLLGRAMAAFSNVSPEYLQVLPPTNAIMDLLKFAAQNHFLGFCMIVDMFERSAYTDRDPFSKVLEDGGLLDAAKQIEIHKKINDSGSHENVVLGFLEYMGPIEKNYAIEALRIAERATELLHSISSEILKRIDRSV